ncbi:MAG: 4Fe-4S binding protein [Clostridia bacterium]|nr:4Fe-4S binding protein [Clostridia bacterium]
MAFYIDEEKCVGCGACKFACLFNCVTPQDDAKTVYRIDEKHCAECSQCADICPNSAISAPEGWKRIKKVVINPEKCTGCSACHFLCHARAPQGERGSTFEIRQEMCYHCGVCAKRCPQKAIDVEYYE